MLPMNEHFRYRGVDFSMRQQIGWLPGQAIPNSTSTRMPERRLNLPVPITAGIVWAEAGEQRVETVALG
jgi:hypothetical protein